LVVAQGNAFANPHNKINILEPEANLSKLRLVLTGFTVGKGPDLSHLRDINFIFLLAAATHCAHQPL
jgi:hypothetical protein